NPRSSSMYYAKDNDSVDRDEEYDTDEDDFRNDNRVINNNIGSNSDNRREYNRYIGQNDENMFLNRRDNYQNNIDENSYNSNHVNVYYQERNLSKNNLYRVENYG